MVARVDWNGTTIWYGDDVQGSVRLLWDRSGTIVGSRSFNGFGQILSESGTKLDRYAYTGREWDAALGLQYTRARMYDPSTGRFLSEDPLGQYAGDVNVYRYVGNSPFAASDPSGQLAWFAPIIIGAGIGAAANYGYYAYKNWGNQTFSGAAKAIAAGGLAGAYGGVAFYGVTAPALGAARPIFGVIADGIVSGGLLNAFNGEDPIMGAAAGGIAAPLGYLILKPIASRIGNYCAKRFAKPKEFPNGNLTGDSNFSNQIAGSRPGGSDYWDGFKIMHPDQVSGVLGQLDNTCAIGALQSLLLRRGIEPSAEIEREMMAAMTRGDKNILKGLDISKLYDYLIRSGLNPGRPKLLDVDQFIQALNPGDSAIAMIGRNGNHHYVVVENFVNKLIGSNRLSMVQIVDTNLAARLYVTMSEFAERLSYVSGSKAPAILIPGS